MSIYVGTTKVSGLYTIGKNIGEVYFSESPSAADNAGGLPLFTGETISNADQVYPQFYDWLSNHPDNYTTTNAYETAITVYGECPKYVIDTVNKTIRLAKRATYIKMANTTDGVTQSDAGLPNITGTFSGLTHDTTSGAFTAGAQSGYLSGASSGGGPVPVSFSAASSNSIYGNSNTVTPQHTTLYPWVFAYNSAIPASVAQASQFQTSLSGKADTNLGNITSAAATNLNSAGIVTIVETYHNGTDWYRIWSDGWCEQGGIDTFSSVGARTASIALIKEYTSANYTISLMGFGSQGTFGIRVSAQSVDGFTYVQSSAEGNYVGTKLYWKTEGYIR